MSEKPPSNEPMRWANLVGANENRPDDGEPTVKGKRRFIPPAKIRQWASESTDGGTATCELCHTRFAMYYIVLVQIRAFKQGFVCKDCKKSHQLQVIK